MVVVVYFAPTVLLLLLLLLLTIGPHFGADADACRGTCRVQSRCTPPSFAALFAKLLLLFFARRCCCRWLLLCLLLRTRFVVCLHVCVCVCAAAAALSTVRRRPRQLFSSRLHILIGQSRMRLNNFSIPIDFQRVSVLHFFFVWAWALYVCVWRCKSVFSPARLSLLFAFLFIVFHALLYVSTHWCVRLCVCV